MPRKTELVLAAPAEPLAKLVDRARAYAADSRAGSTQKAYLSDFASFEAWCARQGVPSAPTTPATVAVYLAALADAGRKASTIERALAGIAWAQRARGHEWIRAHPAIAAVMTGIRRRNGTAPTQKAPVIDEQLAALVGTLDDSLRGLRDRALLTVGWFGAFRRSELVALTVADVKREREGLVVRVRRSKGDQEARGAEKGIPYASRARPRSADSPTPHLRWQPEAVLSTAALQNTSCYELADAPAEYAIPALHLGGEEGAQDSNRREPPVAACLNYDWVVVVRRPRNEALTLQFPQPVAASVSDARPTFGPRADIAYRRA